MGSVRGRCPLMLRTGLLGGAPDDAGVAVAKSTVRVVSETCTVTVRAAWARPRAIFWPATMMTPLWWRGAGPGSVRSRAVVAARPGGPRCSRVARRVSGLGRVRSSSRVSGSKSSSDGVFDADPDPPAAKDLRGEQLRLARETAPLGSRSARPPEAGRRARAGLGSGGWPGGTAPWAISVARSLT